MTAETATYSLSHIRYLEAESIHVMREVVAEFERPVLLYSIGKALRCSGWRRKPSTRARSRFH